MAQGYGGRTTTVSVSEAGEDVLSIFTDIQGRVAAGQATAITATTDAVAVLEDLQLGAEPVRPGDQRRVFDPSRQRPPLDPARDAGELPERLTLTETGTGGERRLQPGLSLPSLERF